MATSLKTVKKKELPKLNFLRSDVLKNAYEKQKRMKKLKKAREKGTGIDPRKSRVIFMTNEGVKRIEARVISLTKSKVTFKGLNRLPVRSILGLEIV